MQRVERPREVGVEDLPVTVWLFAVGVALFAFGLALDWFGYGVEAGLSGALALFFVSTGVLGHLLVWGLGKLD